MSKTTPATLALQKAGIAFALAAYDYDPDVDRIGLAAAEALGVSPSIVFKTLMAEVDGKPACVVLPSDREVSMKKLAAVLDGKSAQMLKPDAAERLTGYKVGGISPFGQKRRVPTVLEATALTPARNLPERRPARPTDPPRTQGCAQGARRHCGGYPRRPLNYSVRRYCAGLVESALQVVMAPVAMVNTTVSTMTIRISPISMP